ncbi:unnamed protein product [Bursaphelenchus xylophilus]|uniref:Methyltransferase-like protein 5 n=1 Tax=Bursaphelenchus xylophilus TaxID=6326 RepID=A0A1I7S8U0_BURXY|nr:unnamed protein product [Bursaphelenchus xylophilus]CAG9085855.1 unnamed protein product [Bursaphelenchus xylophilus]
MKRKHFVWKLEKFKGFDRPKIELEQYETDAEMAVDIIEAISEIEDEIGGMRIADFGCGPGILMGGMALMGAKECVGFEIDPQVIQVCESNLAALEGDLDPDQVVQVRNEDILSETFKVAEDKLFDLIVMNPPFGTKNNEGIDLRFVKKAVESVKINGSVYSLHKSSTREGIQRRIKAWEELQVKFEAVAELNWNLPKTYKFHKKMDKDIQVDLLRFTRILEDEES